MIENVLTLKNVSYRMKTTYKAIISAALIALAVALPQFVHIIGGQAGGIKWLPMYLPVLIGGCLLGWQWGISVGVLSPLVSYFITTFIGSPMPPAVRLPFMIAELSAFALVSGVFPKKIIQKGYWAFAAVISAQIAGRAVFLLSIAIFGSFVSLTISQIWSQILTGLWGLGVQALLVPVIIILLRTALLREKND